jgi:hypothetical protein
MLIRRGSWNRRYAFCRRVRSCRGRVLFGKGFLIWWVVCRRGTSVARVVVGVAVEIEQVAEDVLFKGLRRLRED